MLYDRPIRELLHEAVREMPTPFSRTAVVAWFKSRYPSVKPSSVTAHITAATVNSASRHHYPGADQHLIFRREDGLLERYDASRHGKWDARGLLVRGTGVVTRPTPSTTAPDTQQTARAPIDSGRTFEAHARSVCSTRWGIPLRSAVVEIAHGLSHQFDLVSLDGRIVGDAKWFKNLAVPAAKWSVIAEYVWLLQSIVGVERRFLVFGQDREVPQRWLARFAPLIGTVEFYFLTTEGELSSLDREATQHR